MADEDVRQPGRGRHIRATASPRVLAAKHHKLAATLTMVIAVSSQFAVLWPTSASGTKLSAANGG